MENVFPLVAKLGGAVFTKGELRMAWYFPCLTQRELPPAAGLGEFGLGLLRPSVLPEGDATATRTHGVEAFGHTIGSFCSPLRNTRSTTFSHIGMRVSGRVDHSRSISHCARFRARSRGRAFGTTDRIKTALVRVVFPDSLDLHLVK
ncbi:hypothetical protein [Thiohalomonas denitrificans]|uniref:Uncharacterized protein n=1 Tax=Thiohalomonas denitrificans TaxID=415747 RepID=A0A1G5QE61_9GAMM|nr:hypothetical protein [Thiohalomonas denitrificans]SCZ60153.1 hypothetical protein SAMN03097708_01995 [Thiohalomonas denitrificans]